MNAQRCTPHTYLLVLAAMAFTVATGGCAGSADSADPVRVDGLGTISFANSGAPEAQDDFIRGTLLLHSFEFTPAAEAFRAAQQADPDFALAYWGEAMTYNHPLWREVDLERGREVLRALGGSAEERREKATTERERMYLEAVEALYGDGSKSERDAAYMAAMQRLHEAYPEDDEARTFYALSILGSTNGERDFDVYERAASVARPVFERNPDHPGAAHYIIHSYDDPEHAEQGLAAANAYSGIAPHAAHAQHMTTHIYVALGMWEEVVQNNIRAMQTQTAMVEAEGRNPIHCGHYSSWRHYGHLQLGETEEAEALMDACFNEVASGSAGRGSWGYFADIRGLHIVDTQDWTLAGRWQAEPPTFDISNSPPGATQALTTYLFSNAFAALRSGNAEAAREILGRMPEGLGGDRIMRMELEGLLAIHSGDVNAGIEQLEEAAELETSFPFMFGPPTIVKPTYELLGEELHRAGRAQEAADAFEAALERTPGRRVAVSGAQAAEAAAL